MAHAYTPGLKVTRRTLVRKERKLPMPGDVYVGEGDRVSATQVIAATHLPGPVTMVNVAAEINVAPEEVPQFMLKQEGDQVQAGEVIAEVRAFFGLFHSICRAPVSGTIESISPVSGQVSIRGKPTPVELTAYIDGVVTEVFPGEGAAIETTCALVQGIFGIGGETYGTIVPLCERPDDVLEPDGITEEHKGAVIVGGAMAPGEALRRAIDVGAAAVVTGGVNDQDIDELVGHRIGVAITGHENVGITLVVTEGFGRIPMAGRTFDLLQSMAGRKASVNGATQIRAGVLRPEIIIAEPEAPLEEEPPVESFLEPGCTVRLIRDPYFGLLATVVDLPPEPQAIETEARVRVVRVRLEDGREITVPRANVELIQQ